METQVKKQILSEGPDRERHARVEQKKMSPRQKSGDLQRKKPY